MTTRHTIYKALAFWNKIWLCTKVYKTYSTTVRFELHGMDIIFCNVEYLVDVVNCSLTDLSLLSCWRHTKLKKFKNLRKGLKDELRVT